MKGWVRWVLPLAVVPLIALLAWGLTQDARRLPSALEGQLAPDFTLADLHNPVDSVSLHDFEGQVVVLNFWASWCIPCVTEHPVLVRLYETYDPEDVVLLSVLFQDTPENGQAFIQDLGGDWRMVVDPRSHTAIRYGVYGVPETFFIGADREVALRHDLAVNWDLVSTMVDSLVATRGKQLASPKSSVIENQD